MRYFFKALLTTLLSTSLIAVPMQAQTADFDSLYRPDGAEVRATVTIPFGVQNKTSKNDSRLELGFRTYNDNIDSFDWALNGNGTASLPDYNETRIGLTLEGDRKIMLNGHEWTPVNQALGLEANLKGELKTAAIVVGVVAVLAFAAFALVSQQQSD